MNLVPRIQAAVQAFLAPQRLTTITPSRKHLKKSGRLPMPPASVYAQVAANYSSLTALQKQQLMWWLYKTNLATKSIVRLVVNPIIGDTGISITVPETMPETQGIIDEYFDFNRFSIRKEQRKHLTGYVNAGELCFLTAPYEQTQFSVYCPAALIKHVLLDPLNFEEPIAIVLESDYLGSNTYMYKIITDERRLSEPARIIRSSIEHSCFYDANFEHDEVETVAVSLEGIEISGSLRALGDQYGFDVWQWMQTQRRGEPHFATWADVFNQLVEVMWAMFNRSKMLAAFNYHFEIDTKETDFDASAAKVAEWQEAIGTPEMNSAIYTDANVKVNPMSFPMQSNDIKKILDTMLQMTGLAGNIAPYDLGANLNSTFATARAQGSPQEAFQVVLQSDIEDFYADQTAYVLEQAYQAGMIPQEEIDAAA